VTLRGFASARYLSDGSLDSSFGSGGKVYISISPNDNGAYGSCLQADGKIVMVGRNNNGAQTTYATMRLETNGALDTSFGGSGIVLTTIGSSADLGYCAAEQADQKIVVAGWSNDGGPNYISLARFLPNGAIDDVPSSPTLTPTKNLTATPTSTPTPDNITFTPTRTELVPATNVSSTHIWNPLIKSGRLAIACNFQAPTHCRLMLYSLSGQRVFSTSSFIPNGPMLWEHDISLLSSGSYTAVVEADQRTCQQRIVIIK
jgi:uncharacterized delta-60 repeat protein